MITAGTRLGRYDIRSKLGEGGMGRAGFYVQMKNGLRRFSNYVLNGQSDESFE